MGQDNGFSAGKYVFQFLTRNRVQLEAAYRGSWIIGNAVDCVAEDMTRAGIEITGGMEPHDISRLYSGMSRLGIWQAITDTIKWSRLYGGGLAIMMIKGQDPSTPLRPETVRKGDFLGLYSIDRWIVNPDYSNRIDDFGPELGQPRFYRVIPDADAFGGKVVHHSRVIRLDGIRLPMYQRQYENGWGMSIAERIIDVLAAFDSATLGAAQLVYKAHLRVMKIKNYKQVMGGLNEQAKRGVTAQLDNIRAYQSNEGMSVIDSEDDFQALTYSFAGLNDVLLQFAQQIAGAIQVPMTRLLGQSPAGFSTGESDLRQYDTGISQKRENNLRRPMHRLLALLCYSELGVSPPDDLDFRFGSLWEPSDKEKSEIMTARTTAVVGAFDAGLVDKPTALSELRAGSDIDGMWNSITEQSITDAENEPPDPGEIGAPPEPQQTLAPPDESNLQNDPPERAGRDD